MEGLSRDNLYKHINEKGIQHKDTIAASVKLDKEVFNEMIKDPVIENNYLKRVIKGKDDEIRRLQRRIFELSNIAVMQCEIGTSAMEAISNVVRTALKEGTISEFKIHGVR